MNSRPICAAALLAVAFTIGMSSDTASALPAATPAAHESTTSEFADAAHLLRQVLPTHELVVYEETLPATTDRMTFFSFFHKDNPLLNMSIISPTYEMCKVWQHKRPRASRKLSKRN